MAVGGPRPPGAALSQVHNIVIVQEMRYVRVFSVVHGKFFTGELGGYAPSLREETRRMREFCG
jgi:hypothetical protein